uniref:Uncharacterized protein n=1 Tax=Timema cristinae TaxID=61476 RepID=A0A7R9HCR8_TIMCR|nr:unnamed protein product [Timema cristinae]
MKLEPHLLRLRAKNYSQVYDSTHTHTVSHQSGDKTHPYPAMGRRCMIDNGCTEVFSSSLLDEEPMTLGVAAQFVDPHNLDQADGDWSMDYWDSYGLDEGLLGSVATGVPTSTQPEAPPTVARRR